jgi:hypothetical protein
MERHRHYRRALAGLAGIGMLDLHCLILKAIQALIS